MDFHRVLYPFCSVFVTTPTLSYFKARDLSWGLDRRLLLLLVIVVVVVVEVVVVVVLLLLSLLLLSALVSIKLHVLV